MAVADGGLKPEVLDSVCACANFRGVGERGGGGGGEEEEVKVERVLASIQQTGCLHEVGILRSTWHDGAEGGVTRFITFD